jgi:hypothetical protein
VIGIQVIGIQVIGIQVIGIQVMGTELIVRDKSLENSPSSWEDWVDLQPCDIPIGAASKPKRSAACCDPVGRSTTILAPIRQQ